MRQFHAMPLAIPKADGIAGKSFASRDGKGGR
jgi:hypothetical protein